MILDLIEHLVYGKGKIQKKRFRGFELYVKFEDGIERWVRRDEVRFLSETPVLIEHRPSERVISKEQFKARQIIEALRLGVVPYEYVEEFTFGRKEEIKQIKNWLNNPSDSSLVIIGEEYGVGKTHFLEYIYSYALNNNWAVSIVELDPNEAPFHKPKAIYQKIVSSFRFRKRENDFREFLRQIAKDSEWYKLREHVYLGPVVQSIKDDKDIEDYIEWIEGLSETKYPTIERYTDKIKNVVIEKRGSWFWAYGDTYYAREELKRRGYRWSKKRKAWYKPAEKVNHPPLPNSYTSANIYSYIISGISWAAKNILGLNGLLILFDEAESVDSYWYTSYQNNKGWNFLKGLILMANNDKRLLLDIDNIEHHYSQGWWGKYTDLQYYGRSQLPFIWKIPCYAKTIFTFPSILDILDKEPLNNLDKFEIQHIDSRFLMKILEAIIALYQKAYNFQPNRNQVLKTFELIPRDKTRLFIKGIIEILDLIRFHSDKPVKELLKWYLIKQN